MNKNEQVKKCRDCVCEELIKIIEVQEEAKKKKHGKPEHQEIPFILQTAYGHPFFTIGEDEKGKCFVTIFFRVVSIDKERCCAVLELLKPNKPIVDEECDTVELSKICKVDHVKKTGDCVTVSLNCFCALKCKEGSFIKKDNEKKDCCEGTVSKVGINLF